MGRLDPLDEVAVGREPPGRELAAPPLDLDRVVAQPRIVGAGRRRRPPRARRGRARRARRGRRRAGLRRRGGRAPTTPSRRPCTVPIESGWASAQRAVSGSTCAWRRCSSSLQRAPDRPELLDRADALGAPGGVRRPAADAEAERQRAGVGRDDVERRSARRSRRRRPSTRARSVANVPSPPSSSPCTDATSRSPRSRTPAARIACTAQCAAIKPAFMSHAPRPSRRRRGTRRRTGRRPTRRDRRSGTTSMWPLSISVAPSPVPGKPTDQSPRLGPLDLHAGEVGVRRGSRRDRSASGRPPARRGRAASPCGPGASFSPSVPLTLGIRTTRAASSSMVSVNESTCASTRAIDSRCDMLGR